MSADINGPVRRVIDAGMVSVCRVKHCKTALAADRPACTPDLKGPWVVSVCVLQLTGVGVDELVKRGLLDKCKQVGPWQQLVVVDAAGRPTA